MFSALKKLVGSEQAPGRDKNIPAGLQSMNQALQRRFAKGVQYNMKIVIRGDRNTGKTALWHRLQGKKFVEEYIPTQEIQVTSIHWNYKTTDDIVKVEVWDVVDKGKCKKRGDGLKMENDPQEAESEMALDAEFLDVYKNCNGVVMMFDITKQWTFSYILRELPKVPTHVPVCVLGNYRDMGEHRVILPDDVRDFIDSLDRPPGSSYFRYAESSMKNSFGLKYLHKFFNIPFLQLQRETLLRQLETNQLDIDATLEELSVQQETEDQNYDIFLEMMEARSRGHASPLAANGQSPSSGSQSPVVPPSTVSTGSSSPSTPQPAPQPPLNAPSACPSPPSPLEAPLPPAPPVAPAPPPRRSIISRLFGTSPAAEAAPSPPEPATAAEAPIKVQNVEDFVPEDSLDHSFLDDTAPTKDEKKVGPKVAQDSDSDGEAPGRNPMVADFQDDVDLEDKPPGQPLLPMGPIPKENITLSSEEEAEDVAGHPKATVLAPQKCSEPETKQKGGQASLEGKREEEEEEEKQRGGRKGGEEKEQAQEEQRQRGGPGGAAAAAGHGEDGGGRAGGLPGGRGPGRPPPRGRGLRGALGLAANDRDGAGRHAHPGFQGPLQGGGRQARAGPALLRDGTEAEEAREAVYRAGRASSCPPLAAARALPGPPHASGLRFLPRPGQGCPRPARAPGPSGPRCADARQRRRLSQGRLSPGSVSSFAPAPALCAPPPGARRSSDTHLLPLSFHTPLRHKAVLFYRASVCAALELGRVHWPPLLRSPQVGGSSLPLGQRALF
uniref:Rab-like protein 6 n=1 Tax=Equus caballus TaxID=9796 RepID=A0A9L0RM57_HORSE